MTRLVTVVKDIYVYTHKCLCIYVVEFVVFCVLAARLAKNSICKYAIN